ncbi:MAG: hypothetical protein IJ009_00710 [Clostridia bacterium]|nr:hypothetical protein [Clostridia bacterium]
MKKVLAILLLLCTVFVLCACPGDGPGGGPGDLPENEPDPIDSIPNDINFQGDTLNVSIRNDYVYEIYADSTSQEGIDPEIYKRNAYTERRFNFKLRAKESLCKGELDGETHLNDVRLALQKNSFNFDVIFMWAYQSGKLIKGMNYLDWRLQNEDGSYVIPYAGASLVNEEAWWPAAVNRASTVMGHQYIAVSDMSISSMEAAYSIVFNQNMVLRERIAEGLGYNNMYEIVTSGNWTLDVLYGITKDRYEDSLYNGVYGTRDLADTYGFMYQDATGIDSFINALGFQCVVNDGESMPQLWTMTQTLVSAAEDVVDLCNSLGAVGNPGTEQDYKFFAERHAYFATMKLAALRTATMHGMEDDYGILPYPKLSTDQKEYITGSDDHCSVLSIPLMIDPSRYEIIGVTMDALAARTNQMVKTDFYDTMLKTNSTRNLQDEEMIDLIIRTRAYDFMTYHHGDLFVDRSVGSNGHLHAFFRYLALNPDTSVNDYWDRGKDLLSSGDTVEGSLANLIYQYVNMLG